MGRLGRFFRSAGMYFAGNAFTKIISFFLLPLYTSAIDPAAFGEYSLIVSVLNMVVPVCFMCIWDSVFRFAFECEEPEGKYAVLSACFVVMLIGCVVLALGIVFLFVATGFSHPVLVGAYGVMMAFQYYYTFAVRAFRRDGLFVVSGCVSSVVILGLNVVLILCFSFGIEALYLSYVVGVGVQMLLIEGKEHIVRHLGLKVSAVEVRRYLSFSGPVAGSAVMTWFLDGFSQALIVFVLGSHYNGLYGVANKFPSILIVVLQAFRFAWSEAAYDLSRESDRKRYYADGVTELLRFSVVGAALLIVAVKLIWPVMVDPSYSEGLDVVPLLLIGATANSYAGFLGTLYLAEKRSGPLPRTIALAGLINVVCGLALVGPFGFMGAVAALCVAYLALAAMRLVSVGRRFGARLHGDCAVSFLLLAASVGAFYLLDSLCIVGAFAALLVASTLMLWPQIRRIVRAIKNRS